ncbi:transposase [Streptomyces sp. NPDC004232]|uniref:transposase n=1 Tax=Streptomyces sp. NPDC004232 TaxID=3154454 RepID=UPI001DADE52B|nr:transposase [Streptomyces sp. tea 10]
MLRDQRDVFGAVASTPTAWRVLAGIDTTALNALRAARARTREVAWLQADEAGHPIPASHAGGRELPGWVLDINATLATCHSEKEQSAATYKRGFGYHPMLCFLDNTGEALAGVLRPCNAGANTAADHITVLDGALAQIPDAHRHGTPILIRADSAGGAKAFLAHLRGLRQRGIQATFSVGHAVTKQVRKVIRVLPDQVWHSALEQDGTLRSGAEVAELSDLVDLTGYPDDRSHLALAPRTDHGVQPPGGTTPTGHLTDEAASDHPRPEDPRSTRPSRRALDIPNDRRQSRDLQNEDHPGSADVNRNTEVRLCRRSLGGARAGGRSRAARRRARGAPP